MAIPSQVDFLTKLEREIQLVPGVESAAIVSELPLAGTHMEHNFVMRGRPEVPVGEEPEISAHEASPKYFATMQIPVIAGRVFDDNDQLKSIPVAVITRSMAEQYFHGENPIGAQIAWARAQQKQWMTIVGIVGDVRHSDLAVAPTMQMYLPQTQNTDQFLTLVIRTSSEPSLLAADARRAVAAEARDVPVFEVAPLAELVARSVGPRRFVMVLLELFGGIALLMTAIGVYGVISYSVAERTREIGIRAALGAQPRDIVRLVIGGGLAVVCAGLGAGLILALVASRFLESSLYSVSATDPATFAGVAAVLLFVALVAQGVPIRRAMRVDPTVALRQD